MSTNLHGSPVQYLNDNSVRIRGQIAIVDQLDLLEHLAANPLALLAQRLHTYLGRDLGELVKELELALEEVLLGPTQTGLDVPDEVLERLADLRVLHLCNN